MLKAIAEVTLLIFVLLTGAVSSVHRPPNVLVSASVGKPAWSSCGKEPGLSLELNLKLTNLSKNPVVLGRNEIVNDRFWHKGKKGKLELIRIEESGEDLFDDHTDPDFGKDIREELLPSHGTKNLSMNHIFFLVPTDLQGQVTNQKIIVSFEFTSMRRDGSVSRYSTQPISIPLPGGCNFK